MAKTADSMRADDLPFNEANAIGYWLRREGFAPTHVTVRELRIGYLAFDVEFEDCAQPAAH